MPDTASPEELFVRLYLDHHIKIQLAVDLRTRRYDVMTSQEAGMETAPDEDQLKFATNQDRCRFRVVRWSALSALEKAKWEGTI